MKVKTLASGSKGNCTIVLCDATNIIIDIGITFQKLNNHLEENNLNISSFSYLLLTHSHNDHIKGLSTLIKKTNIKICIPYKMYEEIENIVPIERCVFVEDNFNLNDANIELIHTSHDTNCSVGFIICYNNRSLVYVTDTGYINRKFLNKMKEKNVYIIESNHDEVMLMDGPYPRFLKERVISDKGHLSNNTTAKYLKNIIGNNTHHILLAHLSEKNNTYDLALKTTIENINRNDIQVEIAKQEEESKMIEV